MSTNAVVMAVDDPKPNIGSGSATLNAIICVAEYLAAQEGHKVGVPLASLNPSLVPGTRLS